MSNQPERWAVLAGLDFYQGPLENRLSGCVNDVEYAAALLNKHFSPINVSKFIAEEDKADFAQMVPLGSSTIWPTYNNIVNELKRIIQNANPSAHVYFHYAGHGTLKSTRKIKYSVGSRIDAALVLFDEVSFWGVRYLRGIEMSALFDQMVARGFKLAVVLDCCHSGAVTRGHDLKIRGLDWSDEVDMEHPATQAVLLDDEAVSRSELRDGEVSESWLLVPEGYTVLIACNPDEYAYECWSKYARSHGTFTFHLLEALAKSLQAGQNCDLREIYRIVRARMQYHRDKQHPLFLGGTQNVFMGDMTSNDHTHGVCEVNNYKVSPAQQATAGKSSTQNDVYIEITGVHATESDAKKENMNHPAQIKKGWTAVLTQASNPRAQVRLFANAGKDWIDEIDSSQSLQLNGHASLVPSLPSFSVDITNQSHYTVSSDDAARTLNMDPIPIADKWATAKVITAIEHMAKYANIRLLENTIANTTLGPKTFEIEVKDAANTSNPSTTPLKVNDGSIVKVTLRTRMSTSLYFVALILDPRGGISKLYPPTLDYATVPPRDPRKAFAVKMTVPESLKAKGQLRCDDLLLFIVTARPVSFAALLLPKLAETIANVTRSSGEGVWELLDSLDHANPTAWDSRAGGTDHREKWTCRKFVVATVAKP